MPGRIPTPSNIELFSNTKRQILASNTRRDIRNRKTAPRRGDSLSRPIGESFLKTIVSIGNLVDSPTRRVGELFLGYEYLCKFEAKIGRARNVV
jgi:hypothetical protein